MSNVIAGYRRMLGMSQVEMANKIGISLQAYRNKEKGRSEFKQNEMLIFLQLIKIVVPDATADKVFFAEKVSSSIEG